MGEERPEDLPLHDEAMARQKWRGGETLLRGNGGGAGLPASETDDARLGSDESNGSARTPGPGIFAPPD